MRRCRFFDYLDDDNGSVTRARSTPAHVAELAEGGPWAVMFEDSGQLHEVELAEVNGAYHGDCFDLDEHGDRVQRCRGFAFNDGPCAHLYVVWSRLGRGDIDLKPPREERVRADGGRRLLGGGHDGRVFGRPEGGL